MLTVLRRDSPFGVRPFHRSPVQCSTKNLGNRPPSKTFKEKKDWLESRRQANKKVNETAKNSGFKTDWLIKSAVVVERPQVLTPEPEPWFAQYQEWRLRWDKPIVDQYPHINELDEDLDEQRRKVEDREKAAKALAKLIATETAEERNERVKREEREERLKLIRQSHKAERVVKERSRRTEADHNNDRKSVYRWLDKKLFLIVKDAQTGWQFPGGMNKKPETLRDTAERIFSQDCTGADLETHFVGHGPAGFQTYPLDAETQKKEDAYGIKTFFFYAYYVVGDVEIKSKNIVDYQWVAKDELHEYFSPELLEVALEMLPPDGKHETLERQDRKSVV